MEEKKKSSIIDFMEVHLGLISALSSLFGIIFTGLLRYNFYWYEKGYFDYWEIPVRYMEIDQINLLVQLFYNFSITFVFITFCIIYIKIYDSCKKKGRILLHIVPLLINILIVWYVNYRIGGTFSEVLNLKNEDICYFYIWLECIFYPMEIGFIHLFKRKSVSKSKKENKRPATIVKEKKLSEEVNEEIAETDCKDIKIIQEAEHKRENKIISRDFTIWHLALAVYIICVILYISFNLYNNRKDKCKDTTKFEVIQDKAGEKYVILAIYEGKVFVKPCTLYEERHFIAINADKYRLMELGDKEVEIYNFNDKKEAFKLLNSKEYMEEISNDSN